MADRRDGNSSRRGGDRSHYNDRDRRRDHDRRRVRDDDKDGHQDRSRDYGRDKERDRDRDRRPHKREDGRGGNRTPKDRGDKSVREDAAGRLDRPTDVNKSAPITRNPTLSPDRRSESPNRGFDHPIGNSNNDHQPNTHLPTRVKPSTTGNTTPSAPLSFKVKTNSDSADAHSRPLSRSADHDMMGDSSHNSFDNDAMDQDHANDQDEEELVVEDDGLDQMAAMMGFGGFGTTKNKHVVGNNVGTVKKEKKTQYRQYMNRVGGFNRPLSPPR